MVNVKLLKKVRKLIAEEPRRLQMQSWSRKVSKSNPENPPCGTVACLAGWIVLAGSPMHRLKMRVVRSGYEQMADGNDFPARAARLVGIALSECPFWQVGWKVPEVLAWIDRQIDAASK